jgi:hypothetical protein
MSRLREWDVLACLIGRIVGGMTIIGSDGVPKGTPRFRDAEHVGISELDAEKRRMVDGEGKWRLTSPCQMVGDTGGRKKGGQVVAVRDGVRC